MITGKLRRDTTADTGWRVVATRHGGPARYVGTKGEGPQPVDGLILQYWPLPNCAWLAEGDNGWLIVRTDQESAR